MRSITIIGLFVIERKINSRIVSPLFATFPSIKFFSCSLTRKVYANGLVLFAITLPPFFIYYAEIFKGGFISPVKKITTTVPSRKIYAVNFRELLGVLGVCPLTRRFKKSVFGKPNTFLAIMLRQPFYLIVFSCLLGVEKARQFITVGLSFPRF